jgi:hypothetical protein
MASLTDRVKNFVRSPEARRLADKAEKLARDPRNRRRLEALRDRLGRRR